MSIVQTLGFDASGAIAEIGRLSKAYGQLDSAVGKTARTLSEFNRAAVTTPGTLGQMAQSAGKLGTSFSGLSTNANAAAKAIPAIAGPQTQAQFAATVQQSERLGVSLKLISRVVATQAIVSTFRVIRSEIGSTARAAAAFQKQLAEINNLSDKFTPDKAGAGIRAVSDKFGIGLPETGKALADIVGNQVGKNPEEQLQFLQEAAALSKSGVATLDGSAQLLSAITNSYGKDVAEVGRVSSILFKTTDLGSTTVEALAGAMGRVLPQAKLLGVSLEEVAAGFSTLTRFGTNTPESATQLAGSFSAFIKPSDAMKEAFEKLGVSGGEALIAMRGYQGALKAVIGTTDGSSQAIGKLFSNIRGLNAALKLGSQQASAYADDLKQIQAVPSSLSREKAANVTGTDGQRLAAEAQKLHNAVVIEGGQSILKAGVALSDFAGGADTVVQAMRSIGPAAIGAGAGVAILTARTKLGVTEGTALFGVLGKLAGGLTALGVAASAGDFIGNKLADSMFGDFKMRVEDNINALQRFKDAQQNLIAGSAKDNTDKIRSALASGEGIDLDRLSKIVNRPVTKENQGEALTEARDRLTVFQQITAAADAAQKKISGLRGEILAANSASAGTFGKLGKLFSGPNAGPALGAIESIRNEIVKLSQSGEVSEEQIDSLAKRIEQVKAFAGQTPATKLGFETEAASLDGALSRLKQIRDLQKSVPGADRARQQAGEIQEFLSDLPVASFTEMQNALGAGVQFSGDIADNLERAANAAERAAKQKIGSGGGAPTEEDGFYLGGLVKPRYFANGGPVGSDRVPAWLTPGEMVMNRGTTSKFYSQLSAMNSGSRPAAQSRVGDTHNVTFNGGINVAGGSTNDATGRAIIQSIRRETRRGSAKL